MMELQHIFNKLKDENEIAIVEKYGRTAKRYTIAFTGKTIFIDLYIIIFLIQQSSQVEKSR